MSKFTEGTRVVMISETNKIRKGEIKSYYENLNVAIVNFDDGNVEKVELNRLGIENDVREDKVEESIEKDVITITRNEYKDAVMKAVDPDRLDSERKMNPNAYMIMSLTGILVATELEKILFDEKSK